MSRFYKLWPLAIALAAASLALAGYSVLRPAGAEGDSLRRSLTRLAEPKHEAAAEARLTQATRAGSTRLRAQAANVLAGVLIREHGARELGTAVRLYATAVGLDPADDASKFDLELLLTLGGRRQQSGSNRSKAHATAPSSRSIGTGAGAYPSGKGY